MAVINRVKEFLNSRGVISGYQFWKDTGLPQSTAFRLYGNRNVYPSKKVMDIICRTYGAKPGDLLDWISNEFNQDALTKQDQDSLKDLPECKPRSPKHSRSKAVLTVVLSEARERA